MTGLSHDAIGQVCYFDEVCIVCLKEGNGTIIIIIIDCQAEEGLKIMISSAQ